MICLNIYRQLNLQNKCHEYEDSISKMKSDIEEFETECDQCDMLLTSLSKDIKHRRKEINELEQSVTDLEEVIRMEEEDLEEVIRKYYDSGWVELGLLQCRPIPYSLGGDPEVNGEFLPDRWLSSKGYFGMNFSIFPLDIQYNGV